MIGRLTGKVSEDLDGTIIVDVQGVGYEVIVPIGTVGRAATDAEGRVTLFIHTHAREDALVLFGFATESDRIAFRTLIGVSNVGPKTAITLLSSLPGPDLGLAIARKELGRLTAVPGIGKKTAERLLLELKDKLPVLEAATTAAGGPKITVAAAPRSSTADLLNGALLNMGYRPAEADRAIETLGRDGKLAELPLPDLLKEALAVLSK